MLPATPPAIHYTISVDCTPSPCSLPIQAQMYGGGGFPTPVPPFFTKIWLRIDPLPTVMPRVTWRSHDPSIAYPSFESPLEHTMILPGDTAATPPPNLLTTLLIPGGSAANHIGDVSGTTLIDADIGAPVNERVTIPVYSSAGGSGYAPPHNTPSHLAFTSLGKPQPSPPLSAHIDYADSIASTYGDAQSIFTEIPWPKGTGGFVQVYNSVRVVVSPQPLLQPSAQWSIDGDSATLEGTYIRGVHPGTATLHASVGPPLGRELSIPVITYATLVLPCRYGVRFASDGSLSYTQDADASDLFLTCSELQVPGGAVLVTNGDDPARKVAPGAIRGPQFPELSAPLWQDAFTVLDARAYVAAIEPCNVPESPGVSRVDWSCTTMPARTVLLRTRAGRFVKWLIQIGNGFSILAGPYQVL